MTELDTSPSTSRLPGPDPSAGDPSRPIADRYDAVVIGSGMGGCTTAAVMARAGMRVLLVERAPGPGGCTRLIRSGEYVIDRGVHVTGQGGPGEIFDELTRFLGVEDQVDLVPVGHYYAVATPDRFPGDPSGDLLHLPSGFEAFVATHQELFPSDAAGIRRFFDICEQVHREAHDLPPNVGLKDLDEVVARFPVLFAHTRATLAEVLAEHLEDPRAKMVVAASWPYIGVPPERVSFMTFTQMIFSQMEGTYFSRGSFQRLPDAMVGAVRRYGGDVLFGTEVTSVDVADGAVRGVRLADGRAVSAPVVVHAGDATRLFERMLDGGGPSPKFARRLRRMRPSWSAFAVYAATSADLSADAPAHETFCFRHWDHAQTGADIETGRPGGLWLNIPTLIDPSLAPQGRHLLIMTSLAPYDVPGGWEDARPRYTRELVAEIERVCPSVTGQVEVLDTATPVSMEQQIGNRDGAIYGWDYLPEQSGSKRMSHHTDIAGLFLAGHWTQPGAATLRVLVSGIHTAQLALRFAGRAEAARLGFRDLPPI